jgi:hypothetical protein
MSNSIPKNHMPVNAAPAVLRKAHQRDRATRSYSIIPFQETHHLTTGYSSKSASPNDPPTNANDF